LLVVVCQRSGVKPGTTEGREALSLCALPRHTAVRSGREAGFTGVWGDGPSLPLRLFSRP